MLPLHVCVDGDSGVILSDNAVNFNGVLDFVVFTNQICQLGLMFYHHCFLRKEKILRLEWQIAYQ